MGIAILALMLQALGASVPEDSVDALRDAARDAQGHYEFLARRLAPVTFGSGWSGDDCDEVVGRFCLRYDDGDGEPEPPEPPPEQPGRVAAARKAAIEAYRRYFAVRPGQREAAGPLIRYLVEDGREREALSAARAYAWAAQDSVWAPMLLGFALHANGDEVAAEAAFDRGVAALPPDERERLLSAEVLVEPDERDYYERLGGSARSRYDEAFWRLADPLYLVPGNGRRAEHLARRVQARLMSEAPVVRGMYRWGDDLDELTARYGPPVHRERVLGSGLRSTTMVEHYADDALNFAPPALHTAGPLPQPGPGGRWVLDNPRARSEYTPVNFERVFELPHQVSLFPHGDSATIRIDASLALDSLGAVTTTRVVSGLFLLDSLYAPLVERRGVHHRHDERMVLAAELTVPPGRYVYSIEAADTITTRAARSRHAIDVEPFVRGLLSLSDPVVCRPFADQPLPESRSSPTLQPRTSLVVAPADTLGIYAEAHHLAAGPRGVTEYAVELALREADSSSLPARAIGWLGRRLGLGGDGGGEPRLSWSGEGEVGMPAVIAVDLDLAGVDEGLYRLELTVRDLVLRSKRVRSRLILVEDREG